MIYKDLWNLYDEGEYIAITTNRCVKKNGEAVMGRGCALGCAIRFPWFPAVLGDLLTTNGNKVHRIGRIFTFPVKNNWYEKADLELIRDSLMALYEESRLLRRQIYLPKPGCGNGKLKWEEVEKVINNPLFIDNIVVVDFPENNSEN